MSNNEERSLIVTVGSTKFDKLMKIIEKESIQFNKLLIRFKIQTVLIQHGRSDAPKLEHYSSTIKYVDYLKPEEMTKALNSACVIISHGGAGTIFEILRADSKKLESLIIVENDTLMDSHQSELIDALIEIKCPIQRGNFDNLFDDIREKRDELKHFNLPDPNYEPLESLIKSYLMH